MKRIYLTSLAIGIASLAMSQAQIQIIHNSADLAAATVDVRINGGFADPSLDNLAFREATPFLTVPAGTYTVTIHPPTSVDASNPLFTKTLTVVDNENYVVMAAGIVSPTGYAPATPFDLFVKTGARTEATVATNNDILVFHGATDAPTVKVKNVTNPLATSDLVASASFNNFTDYIEVPNANYDLQIRTLDETSVAEYGAPLQTLNAAGASVTVMASGFLNPTANSNGPAFGLFAVLANGTVIPLPSQAISTARLQVVHNCASPAAATVDVWANGAIKLIPNFAFRTATPFIDVPAGVDIALDITAPNSTDVSGSLYDQTINLEGGEKYVAVASGTIGGTFLPATPFSIIAFDGARESAATAGDVDVRVFHGATDAPAVDVRETSVPAGVVVSGIEFGENQGYLSLDPAAYVLQIEAAGTPVISYNANLSGTANAAITVFASGFLNPAANENGAGFGLWFSTPAGGALTALPVNSGLGLTDLNTIQATVYPNPAQTTLNISTPEKLENATFTVSDLQGRSVISGAFNTTIDIANLQAGVYVLNVVSGTKNTSVRFVKD